MRQKPGTKRSHGEKVVKDIRRATRKQYSAEEKIRIVLDGLKGEESIAGRGVVNGMFPLPNVERCNRRDADNPANPVVPWPAAEEGSVAAIELDHEEAHHEGCVHQ